MKKTITKPFGRKPIIDKPYVDSIEPDAKEVDELFAYAKEGNIEKLKSFHLERHCGYNVNDANGDNILHYIINLNDEIMNEQNKKVIIEFMINKGVSINKQNDKGIAPIHLAFWNQYFDIIKLLEEKKADFKMVNKLNQNIIHYLLKGKAADKEKIEKQIDVSLKLKLLGNIDDDVEYGKVVELFKEIITKIKKFVSFITNFTMKSETFNKYFFTRGATQISDILAATEITETDIDDELDNIFVSIIEELYDMLSSVSSATSGGGKKGGTLGPSGSSGSSGPPPHDPSSSSGPPPHDPSSSSGPPPHDPSSSSGPPMPVKKIIIDEDFAIQMIRYIFNAYNTYDLSELQSGGIIYLLKKYEIFKKDMIDKITLLCNKIVLHNIITNLAESDPTLINIMWNNFLKLKNTENRILEYDKIYKIIDEAIEKEKEEEKEDKNRKGYIRDTGVPVKRENTWFPSTRGRGRGRGIGRGRGRGIGRGRGRGSRGGSRNFIAARTKPSEKVNVLSTRKEVNIFKGGRVFSKIEIDAYYKTKSYNSKDPCILYFNSLLNSFAISDKINIDNFDIIVSGIMTYVKKNDGDKDKYIKDIDFKQVETALKNQTKECENIIVYMDIDGGREYEKYYLYKNEIMKYMYENNPHTNELLVSSDVNGNTPLHYAIDALNNVFIEYINRTNLTLFGSLENISNNNGINPYNLITMNYEKIKDTCDSFEYYIQITADTILKKIMLFNTSNSVSIFDVAEIKALIGSDDINSLFDNDYIFKYLMPNISNVVNMKITNAGLITTVPISDIITEGEIAIIIIENIDKIKEAVENNKESEIDNIFDSIKREIKRDKTENDEKLADLINIQILPYYFGVIKIILIEHNKLNNFRKFARELMKKLKVINDLFI